jgi:hypothetical protein
MKSYITGLVCIFLALVLLFGPAIPVHWPEKPEVPIETLDLPAQAFKTYEQIWRTLAQEAADKLDSGELKSENEVWEFLAKGQEPARKVAFDAVARAEKEYFESQRGWSAAAHAKLLRSYIK